MENEKISRFTALKFRNRKQTQNRIVVPAMASETADNLGFATVATVDHYKKLASSGAGIVMVEYSFVDINGRSEQNQLGANTDAHIPGLANLAKAIHDAGALAGLQITHAGGKSKRIFTKGLPLQGPSGIAVPARDQIFEKPNCMSHDEIKSWKLNFANAALRAHKAGFDFVELHAAHGYGLNQWLSPLTNQRTDDYGGNLENRARLLYEIIHEIQQQVPEMLLSTRIPGQDFLEGGLSISNSKLLAQRLEVLGLDIINVSSGIGGWRRPRDRQGEGYLVEEARAIQSSTRLPVIGVGGIENGHFIDGALNHNAFSLAAVGRAILANPQAWRLANLEVAINS